MRNDTMNFLTDFTQRNLCAQCDVVHHHVKLDATLSCVPGKSGKSEMKTSQMWRRKQRAVHKFKLKTKSRNKKGKMYEMCTTAAQRAIHPRGMQEGDRDEAKPGRLMRHKCVVVNPKASDAPERVTELAPAHPNPNPNPSAALTTDCHGGERRRSRRGSVSGNWSHSARARAISVSCTYTHTCALT